MKMVAKIIGVWPMCRLFKMPRRETNYTTLMMATGLTFGSISALFGFNYGYIDQAQYSILVTVVIASAVIPTVIAQVLVPAPGGGPEAGERNSRITAPPSTFCTCRRNEAWTPGSGTSNQSDDGGREVKNVSENLAGL